MYPELAKSRLIPEKIVSHYPDFALFFNEINAREAFMTDIRICKAPDCSKPAKPKQSLCSMHMSRWYKYYSYDLPLRPEADPKKGYVKLRAPIPDGYVRVCKIHGNLKVDQCYKTTHTKKGKIYFKCKKCRQNAMRTWEKRNPDKVKKMRHRCYLKSAKSNSVKAIVRQKLITLDEYNRMFEVQNNKCAICKKEESILRNDGTPSPLCVDHCHETGLTRELLCRRCNHGIGFFNDREEIMINAMNYVKKWKEKHRLIQEASL